MLNRCPSCQASVLDDDAETCPFCGSPMDPAKAKGYKPAGAAAAKPVSSPAPKTAASVKPAGAPASKPTAATASPPPRSSEGRTTDDDPFAIDHRAGSAAIALSPKRTQQRPHKVVCPMCDTAGYASEAASGKEVRCANPKCMVPVFKAPDFAAPKPPEPEPPASKLNPTVLTFGIVGLILAGAAVWWFTRPPRPQPGPLPGNAMTPSMPTPVTPTEGAGNAEPSAAAQPAARPPAEVLKSALGRFPALASDVVEPQRQPLRRRYAAEAFALAGDVDSARKQLADLAETRSADPFYQISPLAEIAWANWRGGDDAAAKAVFEQVRPLAAQIPGQGFDPARVAIDWAAAAAKAGDEGAARELADAPRDDAAGERLLALLESAALFSEGDLNAEYALRPVRPLIAPKTAAVTAELLRRGESEAAKAWAGRLENPAVRSENLAIWGEAVAAAPGASEKAIAEIEGAVSKLDLSEQALVFARAAKRLAGLEAGKPRAQALLARAKTLSDQFPAPAPAEIPAMAALARAELPDPAIPTLRATALAEAAHAAALLGDPSAPTYLVAALDHLRSAAPAPAAVAERQRELDALGISGVQSQLKTDLGLQSDDQARQAANLYRRKLQDLQSHAAARFDLQAEILSRAVRWKLGAKVVELARAAQDAEGGLREPLLTGDTGGRLLAAFRAARDTAGEQAATAAKVTDRDVPPAAALEAAVDSASGETKPATLGQELSSTKWARVGRSEKLSAAIRIACRVAQKSGAADALALTGAIRDEVAREEVLRYLSAYLGGQGKGGEVQERLPQLRLSPTEEAAVLRGLVQGVVSAGAGDATDVVDAAAVGTESP